MRRFIKILTVILALLCSILMSKIAHLDRELPAQFYMKSGTALDLNDILRRNNLVVSESLSNTSKQILTLKLFGLFPVKNIKVNIVDQTVVVPCGTPIGIRMFTKKKTDHYTDNKEKIQCIVDGIGMMTFYDPNTSAFGGLGHAIRDFDSAQTIPVSNVKIFSAAIYDVKAGTKHTPGNLQCLFSPKSVGNLLINEETGIYGFIKQPNIHVSPVPIGMKQTIKVGNAQILTTIDGDIPKPYHIRISKINYQHKTNNLVIQITDKALLNRTGGVVRGMSGSPILQDGKLIGAVTHVFANDPTQGYGIFAETMLWVSHTLSKNIS